MVNVNVLLLELFPHKTRKQVRPDIQWPVPVA